MKSYAAITGSLAPCTTGHRTLTRIHNWSRLIRTSVLITVLCFLLAALAGCRQPKQPVSYEDLCGLSSEQMGVMNDEEVRQWLEEEYGTASPVILDAILEGRLEENERDLITAYAWEEKGRTGIAYLRDERLFRISLRYIGDRPTFGQVVGGLGTPDMIGRSVITYGGDVVYSLGLDYPELGVSVSASAEMTAREVSRPAEEWAVTLKEDMQVDSVSCYTPVASMEEVLHKVFFVSPENVSYAMQRQMPWPGFGSLVPLDY
jgi:hypothetical protein